MSTFQRQSSRGVLTKRCFKICCKFTREHPYRSAISIKLLSSFIEITLLHGCSLVNLLHIFRTPFPKNTSECLLLTFRTIIFQKFCRWLLQNFLCIYLICQCLFYFVFFMVFKYSVVIFFIIILQILCNVLFTQFFKF